MSFGLPKIPALGTFRYTARVRYYEVDSMGRVHHATYLKYFENARTEWLRHYGVTYKEIEASGIFMPVIDVSIRYKYPLVYDELFHVEISFYERPKTRASIFYRVVNEEAKLVCEAKTDLCFLDAQKNRPVAAPLVFTEFIEHAIND